MCAMRKTEINFFSVFGRKSRDSLTTQILVTMHCRASVFAFQSCRHRLNLYNARCSQSRQEIA